MDLEDKECYGTFAATSRQENLLNAMTPEYPGL
jgi:hypothetical protein